MAEVTPSGEQIAEFFSGKILENFEKIEDYKIEDFQEMTENVLSVWQVSQDSEWPSGGTLEAALSKLEDFAKNMVYDIKKNKGSVFYKWPDHKWKTELFFSKNLTVRIWKAADVVEDKVIFRADILYGK